MRVLGELKDPAIKSFADLISDIGRGRRRLLEASYEHPGQTSSVSTHCLRSARSGWNGPSLDTMLPPQAPNKAVPGPHATSQLEHCVFEPWPHILVRYCPGVHVVHSRQVRSDCAEHSDVSAIWIAPPQALAQGRHAWCTARR